MNKATVEMTPAILDVYRKLVADYPGLSHKGVSMPYTSLNGNMFSFVTNEGKLALRLPDGDRQEFMARFHTNPVIQHGALMKEYVEVPDVLLKDQKELFTYFTRSYEHASTIKPKPVKGKRDRTSAGS